MKYSFVGIVRDGRFHPRDKEGMKALMSKLEGKLVTVSPRLVEPPRSNNQNRYYWGVVVAIIADFVGVELEETHMDLRRRFLLDSRDVELPDGRTVSLEFAKSTKSLSTREFEDYVDRVRMWAGYELGLSIPLPNEVDLGEVA